MVSEMETDNLTPHDKICCLDDKNVSLDTSTTTLSSSFSESRFDDYLARYTVAPSEFFANLNNKTNNNNGILGDGSGSDGDASGADSESETESAVEAKVERAARTLHEIFVEGCCALYSDLRDALDDDPSAHTTKNFAGGAPSGQEHDHEPDCDRSLSAWPGERELADRLRMLRRQAGELAAAVPQLADTAELRLATLERAMQQLRIHRQQQQQQSTAQGQQQGRGSGGGGAGDATAPSQRFRKWLQASECELAALRRRVNRSAEDLAALQRLRADHQVLQLQIETEGRALLNSAYQQLHVERQTIESLGELSAEGQLKSPAALFDQAAKRLGRWHRNLEVLEHRWYTHWLASLEGLEVVGRLVDRLSELDSSCCSQSDSESDGEEPLCKRLRRSLTPKLRDTSGPDRNNDGSRSQSISKPGDELKRLNKLERVRETPTRMLKATLRNNHGSAKITAREVITTVKPTAEISDQLIAVDHKYDQFTRLIEADKKAVVSSDALSSASEGSGCSRASSSSSNGAPTSQDIGYSSGENNSTVDAADVQRTNPDAGGKPDGETTVAEAVIKSYYRTVPLDDAGVTDTECGRLLVPSLLTPGDNANHLTDSLIVQVDNNLHNTSNGNTSDMARPLDDFEEVMEMMDEQFQTQLELLRRGTQWRELRATGGNCRRASGGAKHRVTLPMVPPRLNVTLPHRISSTGSCDASSEESDNNRHGFTVFRNAHSLTASLCGTIDGSTATIAAAEPTITVTPNSDDEAPSVIEGLTPRRKRYHRRSTRNPENKVNGSANGCGLTTTVVVPVPIHIDNQKISAKLKDVSMNQSVYVTGHSDSEKSQDEATEPSLGKVGASSAVRRFAATRRRMHRSASDNAALCDGGPLTTVKKMSASTYEDRPKHSHHHHHHHYHHFCVHSQPICCCKCQSKRSDKGRGELLRTCSVESCHSSSSSVTVHESGDAHFEWDEYKDFCDLMMPPSRAEFADGLHVDDQKHSTPKKSPSHSRQNGSSNNDNNSADRTVLDPEAAEKIAAHGDDAFFAGGAAADAQRLARSDAESDADEAGARATLDASRVQLRVVEKLVKGVGAKLAARKRVARKNNPHNTRPYVDKLTSARATATENLQRLSEHVRDTAPLDMDEISELEKLRESWTQILVKIVKMTRSYSANEPSSGEENTTAASRVSEGEGEVISLHTVLEEMKAQLGRLMKCDNGATNVPLSLADIEAVVATRKEILCSLLHYRDDLRDLTAEAKRRAPLEAPATFQRSSDVLELMTLMEMVERSLSTIQSSTVSLERLREDFSGLCALFLSLDAKIDRLNRVVSPTDEGDGALSTKAIESELDLCQERMNALETVCNTLSPHLSMTSNYYQNYADVAVLADASDDEIPTEPHPPVSEHRDNGHSISPIPTAANCPGLREFSELRQELERLKDRFQKVVAHKEPSRLNNSTSTPTPATPSRKRRLSEDQTSSNNVESTEERRDIPPQPAVTVASVATQSDISAETVRNYEERLIAARASRRAARSAKAQTAGGQQSDASESEGGSPAGGGLKRRRAVRQKSPVADTPPRLSHTLRAAVRDSRLAQLCLGCALALALGLLLLQLFGELDEARNPMLANNYRWTFGPQLDYVAGPPPR